MKITALSDLHGYLPTNVPPADVVIIAGDVCPDVTGSAQPGRHLMAARGQLEFLRTQFAPWLERLPAERVVLVWGNHDYAGELPTSSLPALRADVLTDRGIEIDGISIYGSPWTFMMPDVWAFDAPEDQIDGYLQAMPARVDILVTHGPPHGVLDRLISGKRVGSHAIKSAVERVKPRLHIFGHIHESRGQEGTSHNVSVLDENYQPFDKPIVTLEIEA